MKLGELFAKDGWKEIDTGDFVMWAIVLGGAIIITHLLSLVGVCPNA